MPFAIIFLQFWINSRNSSSCASATSSYDPLFSPRGKRMNQKCSE